MSESAQSVDVLQQAKEEFGDEVDRMLERFEDRINAGKINKDTIEGIISNVILGVDKAKTEIDTWDINTFSNDQMQSLVLASSPSHSWSSSGILAQETGILEGLTPILEKSSKENRYGRQVYRTEMFDFLLDKLKNSSRNDKDAWVERMLATDLTTREEAPPLIALRNAMHLHDSILSKDVREALAPQMEASTAIKTPAEISSSIVSFQVVVGGDLIEIPTNMLTSLQLTHIYQEGKYIYAQMSNGCEGNLVIMEVPTGLLMQDPPSSETTPSTEKPAEQNEDNNRDPDTIPINEGQEEIPAGLLSIEGQEPPQDHSAEIERLIPSMEQLNQEARDLNYKNGIDYADWLIQEGFDAGGLFNVNRQSLQFLSEQINIIFKTFLIQAPSNVLELKIMLGLSDEQWKSKDIDFNIYEFDEHGKVKPGTKSEIIMNNIIQYAQNLKNLQESNVEKFNRLVDQRSDLEYQQQMPNGILETKEGTNISFDTEGEGDESKHYMVYTDKEGGEKKVEVNSYGPSFVQLLVTTDVISFREDGRKIAFRSDKEGRLQILNGQLVWYQSETPASGTDTQNTDTKNEQNEQNQETTTSSTDTSTAGADQAQDTQEDQSQSSTSGQNAQEITNTQADSTAQNDANQQTTTSSDDTSNQETNQTQSTTTSETSTETSETNEGELSVEAQTLKTTLEEYLKDKPLNINARFSNLSDDSTDQEFALLQTIGKEFVVGLLYESDKVTLKPVFLKDQNEEEQADTKAMFASKVELLFPL